jgi:hypothetical protein
MDQIRPFREIADEPEQSQHHEEDDEQQQAVPPSGLGLRAINPVKFHWRVPPPFQPLHQGAHPRVASPHLVRLPPRFEVRQLPGRHPEVRHQSAEAGARVRVRVTHRDPLEAVAVRQPVDGADKPWQGMGQGAVEIERLWHVTAFMGLAYRCPGHVPPPHSAATSALRCVAAALWTPRRGHRALTVPWAEVGGVAYPSLVSLRILPHAALRRNAQMLTPCSPEGLIVAPPAIGGIRRAVIDRPAMLP